MCKRSSRAQRERNAWARQRCSKGPNAAVAARLCVCGKS